MLMHMMLLIGRLLVQGRSHDVQQGAVRSHPSLISLPLSPDEAAAANGIPDLGFLPGNL